VGALLSGVRAVREGRSLAVAGALPHGAHVAHEHRGSPPDRRRGVKAVRARTAARLNTYEGYSAACAAVWAAILLAAMGRLDAPARNALALACGGWWSGWLSATIARATYPAPTPLEPTARSRLAAVSLALVAVGLGSVLRLLVCGGRRGATTI